MRIVVQDGLHYVVGLPEWVDYAIRAVYFVMAVLLTAACYGVYKGTRDSPGWHLLLIGLGVLALRAAVTQVERWDSPLAVEGAVTGVLGMGLILASMARWLSRCR